MAKYNPSYEHRKEGDEAPPAWKEQTSAKGIEIDVQIHNEGYQTDKKWKVHISDTDEGNGVAATHAVKYTNKGNFWRPGERWDDATTEPMPGSKVIREALRREASGL